MNDETRATFDRLVAAQRVVEECFEALEPLAHTLAVRATPGPWATQGCSHGGRILLRGDRTPGAWPPHIQGFLQIVPTEDAELIAHAPSWLAALCEALEEGER